MLCVCVCACALGLWDRESGSWKHFWFHSVGFGIFGQIHFRFFRAAAAEESCRLEILGCRQTGYWLLQPVVVSHISRPCRETTSKCRSSSSWLFYLFGGWLLISPTNLQLATEAACSKSATPQARVLPGVYVIWFVPEISSNEFSFRNGFRLAYVAH